ncbi:hypothetical protein BJ912DRAFT_124246 [Pholiota molesta]|nr:hypothetical protein BJ912DRAFT_124246 [Pholiota molesta]
MTRRKFPPTRGRTHHRSSSSVSNTQASNSQPPNDPIPFPVTLGIPALDPVDVAALRRKFPDTFGKLETVELPSPVRPPAPPDGLSLLDGIHGSDIITPPIHAGQLPTQLRISLPESVCVCPTHIIACPPEGKRKTYTLFLVHSSVLEANCASLPQPFPPSLAPVASNSSTTLDQAILPVITYDLPYPDAFLAMQTWMYMKDDLLLFEMAIPSNRSLWATSYDAAERQLDFLYGMWRNARYLGVIDMALYDVLKVGWNEVYATRAGFSR